MLELKILIGGNENVEPIRGFKKELTVLQARSARLQDGHYGVCRKLVS